jgi:hypothetical protein
MRYVFLFLPAVCLIICGLIIRFEIQAARKRGSMLSRNEFGQILLALVLGGVAIVFVVYLFMKPRLL